MRCQLARMLPVIDEEMEEFLLPKKFHNLLVWVIEGRPDRSAGYYWNPITRKKDLLQNTVMTCLEYRDHGNPLHIEVRCLEFLPYASDEELQDFVEWLAKGGEKIPDENQS